MTPTLQVVLALYHKNVPQMIFHSFSDTLMNFVPLSFIRASRTNSYDRAFVSRASRLTSYLVRYP